MSVQLKHGKALGSLSIRSLDSACGKAWQTLTTITLSVDSVRSAKTRLSLSHHARSTLCDQAANTNFDHDTLEQSSIYSTYDSLYGLPTTSMTCSSIAASSSRTTGCMDYRPHRQHAPVLLHVVHVRLAVWTSNHFDTPSVNSKNFKNRDIYLPTMTIPATDITRPADYNNNVNIHQ